MGKRVMLVSLITAFVISVNAQSVDNSQRGYWNGNRLLIPFRLSPPPVGYEVEYLDLDGDGDPDVIKSITINDTPVLWIDDDDDMQYGDLEGDTDSDCLLIDRNRDGKYGNLVIWLSIGEITMEMERQICKSSWNILKQKERRFGLTVITCG